MPQSPPNWSFKSVQVPPPAAPLGNPFNVVLKPGTGPSPIAYDGPLNIFNSYYWIVLARTAAAKLKYEYDQIYVTATPAARRRP